MIVPGELASSIAMAVQRIQAGELIAFPTETVYGLGADASRDDAVARIFAAKGRPTDHPLIAHVASAGQVDDFAHDVPDFARKLIAAFWPGPLTLILPRRPGVAAACAGGQDSIGLRCPSHPVAQALLRACAEAGVAGVAAPSANQFGHVSPTTAAHVQTEFDQDLLILDGGACDLGIESTIIDCTRGLPVQLRPGVLTREAIAAACGCRVSLPGEDLAAASAPRASGTLEAHYAPRAALRLMDARALQTALDMLGADAAHIAVYARTLIPTRSSRIIQRRMPDDALATARQLFAVLRDFDDRGAKLIWVETLPPGDEWDGVRDRLQRAAAA
jgi:L-threonylcarbamoyladenylate synthase